MKKLVLISLIFLSIITLSSCNNNISLSVHAKDSEYKNIDLNEMLDEYDTDLFFDESEVYGIINDDLSISYDTFICEYNDVVGIGFSDYNYMYKNDYGYEYVACGFIPFDGENPENQIVDRIDNCDINYINTYLINDYKSHFIMNDIYVSYEIDQNNVKIEYNENDDFYYKSGYGSLYNYDTDEYIYNYEIYEFEDVNLKSLSKIEDTDEILRLINESF